MTLPNPCGRHAGDATPHPHTERGRATTLVYSSGEGGRVGMGGPLRSPCRRRNGRVGPCGRSLGDCVAMPEAQ